MQDIKQFYIQLSSLFLIDLVYGSNSITSFKTFKADF